MENIPKNNTENDDLDLLTSMDLDNSLDYVTDYYINTYDYTLDTEVISDKMDELDGCHVKSTKDSIYIEHENGTDKHIPKKENECASVKYNKKKEEKKSIKASSKSTSTTKKTNTQKKPSSYTYNNNTYSSNKPSNTYKTNNTYNKTSIGNTSSTNTNSSHNEVFNTNNNTNKKNSSNGCVLLFIFLFVFLPYIASILISCVGEIAKSIFD